MEKWSRKYTMKPFSTLESQDKQNVFDVYNTLPIQLFHSIVKIPVPYSAE